MLKLNPTRELKNYHLIGNVSSLFRNEEIADVNFIFLDKKKIPANKCLLAMASPVFRQMFYGSLRETGDIYIVDASYDAFDEFLQFFYCDKLELTTKNIREVMSIADKYDVKQLMNICATFLECNLSIETVCWIFEIADEFNQLHLIDQCAMQICLETTSVLQTECFKSCSYHILKMILCMNQLSCDEIIIFRACMVWATNVCNKLQIPATVENRKMQLHECFDLIRFPTMTAEQFTECVAEDGLIEAIEFLDILSYLTLRKPLKTYRFPSLPRNGTPAWIRDQDIRICDRRSVPNLNYLIHKKQDKTIFSVNERILLGQLSFSTFKGGSSNREQLTGELRICKTATAEQILLSQTIEISSKSFTKILLNKPLIIRPFEDYEIETNWNNLKDDERLLFRTDCRSEIMLDGGIRFQFKNRFDLDYDNVAQGLIIKFYFKKW